MLGAWSRDATPKLVESCRGLRLRVVDGAQCVRGSLGPSAHAVGVKGALCLGIFGDPPNMREDRCRYISPPVLEKDDKQGSPMLTGEYFCRLLHNNSLTDLLLVVGDQPYHRCPK